MYYSHFTPSYKVGDVVTYSPDGDFFPYGCAYVERIIDIIYPEFGGYRYILQSTQPHTFPFKARPDQVKIKDCANCECYNECPNHNEI